MGTDKILNVAFSHLLSDDKELLVKDFKAFYPPNRSSLENVVRILTKKYLSEFVSNRELSYKNKYSPDNEIEKAWINYNNRHKNNVA